jgi:large subunit ribosomal protein L21
MYAVIQSGGKQYKVTEGDVIKLEKLVVEVGDAINFDRVLLVANGDAIQVGVPFLEGGSVSATVLSHGRHKKIRIIKFRRRKHHMKHQGHRQYYTEVKVTGITAG